MNILMIIFNKYIHEYHFSQYCNQCIGIFSEIDEPLDFNENMSTNIVSDVVC